LIVIFIILIGYLANIAPRLIADKQWKELLVVGAVTVCGIVLAGLMMVGVEIPNVTGLMSQAFLKFYRMIGIKV